MNSYYLQMLLKMTPYWSAVLEALPSVNYANKNSNSKFSELNCWFRAIVHHAKFAQLNDGKNFKNSTPVRCLLFCTFGYLAWA